MVISTTVCRHVWTIEIVLLSRSQTIIWWQATSPGGEQNVSSGSRPNTTHLILAMQPSYNTGKRLPHVPPYHYNTFTAPTDFQPVCRVE